MTIYDPGSKLGVNVEKLGEHYGLSEIKHYQGRGEFVGADTREQAHDVYRQIIAAWKDKIHQESTRRMERTPTDSNRDSAESERVIRDKLGRRLRELASDADPQVVYDAFVSKGSILEDAPWEESKHKRGQPHNAGQFGPGGGHATQPGENRGEREAHKEGGTPRSGAGGAGGEAYLKCPSTTSPLERQSIGTANPNSRIDARMRSTAASFFLGFRAYSLSQLIGL